MTKTLRIAGWIMFIAGTIAFLALGGIDGLRETPVPSMTAAIVGALGMLLTAASRVMAVAEGMRRRRTPPSDTAE